MEASQPNHTSKVPIITQTHNHLTKMRSFAWLVSLPMVAEAGEVLWSGRFNASATVADIDKCK